MSAPIQNKKYEEHRDALRQNQGDLKNQKVPQNPENKKLGDNSDKTKQQSKVYTDKQKQSGQKLNQGTQDFTQFNKEDKDRGLDQAQKREREENKVYGQTEYKDRNFENIQDRNKQSKDQLGKDLLKK